MSAKLILMMGLFSLISGEDTSQITSIEDKVLKVFTVTRYGARNGISGSFGLEDYFNTSWQNPSGLGELHPIGKHQLYINGLILR